MHQRMAVFLHGDQHHASVRLEFRGSVLQRPRMLQHGAFVCSLSLQSFQICVRGHRSLKPSDGRVVC
jgi:hypothetical protein